MLQTQRVFFSNNGVMSDWSNELGDFRTGTVTMPFTAAEDYLYIGSALPFNHRFFDIGTANDVASVVSVDIWFGHQWVPAVDIMDLTATGGKSLAQSGIIQWSTNRLKGWDFEDDSDDILGSSYGDVYNKFWVRLKWSVTLKATTALKCIGHKFSDDSVLASYYPDLANTALMDSFATGKANWNDQHFMAAEDIVRNLTRRAIVTTGDQILDWQVFVEASCHKVAEIVYRGLGKAYEQNRDLARNDYEKAMNRRFFNIDDNANGNLEPLERTAKQGWLYR
jgi:hypothetical protein